MFTTTGRLPKCCPSANPHLLVRRNTQGLCTRSRKCLHSPAGRPEPPAACVCVTSAGQAQACRVTSIVHLMKQHHSGVSCVLVSGEMGKKDKVGMRQPGGKAPASQSAAQTHAQAGFRARRQKLPGGRLCLRSVVSRYLPAILGDLSPRGVTAPAVRRKPSVPRQPSPQSTYKVKLDSANLQPPRGHPDRDSGARAHRVLQNAAPWLPRPPEVAQ